MDLPACGIYRTTEPIGEVPANRLVYFHNHGDPGPGVYLPEAWANNRVRFHKRGTTLPHDNLAFTLEPLEAQGLYRVAMEFTCCEKNCVTFPADQLVQLGYNREGTPILFVPRWTDRGLAIPEQGRKIEPDRVAHLTRLRVAEERPPADSEPDGSPHTLH